MSSYAYQNTPYTSPHSANKDRKDKDGRDEGKKSPKTTRPKNPLPCYDCSKAKVRCDTDNQPQGLCVRCHRRGLTQCPPHIPWSMRPGTQYSPTPADMSVTPQGTVVSQTPLMNTGIANHNHNILDPRFQAQTAMSNIDQSNYAYPSSVVHDVQPASSSTIVPAVSQNVSYCPYHSIEQYNATCQYCQQLYSYYYMPQ